MTLNLFAQGHSRSASFKLNVALMQIAQEAADPAVRSQPVPSRPQGIDNIHSRSLLHWSGPGALIQRQGLLRLTT